jgi:hypothetical protein
VTVCDSQAVVFTRIWCIFEGYLSVLRVGKPYELACSHGVTARADGTVYGRATVLTSGLAHVDVVAAPSMTGGSLSAKLLRERDFSEKILTRGSRFDVENGQASVGKDKLDIIEVIDHKEAQLNATMSATISSLRLGRRLADLHSNPVPLTEQLGLLARSSLLRLVVSPPTRLSPARTRQLALSLPSSLNELYVDLGMPEIVSRASALIKAGTLVELGLTSCELADTHASQLGASLVARGREACCVPCRPLGRALRGRANHRWLRPPAPLRQPSLQDVR